jgi:hypothetical protein
MPDMRRMIDAEEIRGKRVYRLPTVEELGKFDAGE